MLILRCFLVWHRRCKRCGWFWLSCWFGGDVMFCVCHDKVGLVCMMINTLWLPFFPQKKQKRANNRTETRARNNLLCTKRRNIKQKLVEEVPKLRGKSSSFKGKQCRHKRELMAVIIVVVVWLSNRRLFMLSTWMLPNLIKYPAIATMSNFLVLIFFGLVAIGNHPSGKMQRFELLDNVV